MLPVGPQEVESLYKRWQGNADGEIDRKEFAAGLQSLGITDPLLIEQYFSAFDQDKNGKINFREFVTGLSVVQRGNAEERLRCKDLA